MLLKVRADKVRLECDDDVNLVGVELLETLCLYEISFMTGYEDAERVFLFAL